MAALGWLLNLGFAGSGQATQTIVFPAKVEAWRIHQPGIATQKIHQPGVVEQKIHQPGIAAQKVVQ